MPHPPRYAVAALLAAAVASSACASGRAQLTPEVKADLDGRRYPADRLAQVCEEVHDDYGFRCMRWGDLVWVAYKRAYVVDDAGKVLAALDFEWRRDSTRYACQASELVGVSPTLGTVYRRAKKSRYDRRGDHVLVGLARSVSLEVRDEAVWEAIGLRRPAEIEALLASGSPDEALLYAPQACAPDELGRKPSPLDKRSAEVRAQAVALQMKALAKARPHAFGWFAKLRDQRPEAEADRVRHFGRLLRAAIALQRELPTLSDRRPRPDGTEVEGGELAKPGYPSEVHRPLKAALDWMLAPYRLAKEASERKGTRKKGRTKAAKPAPPKLPGPERAARTAVLRRSSPLWQTEKVLAGFGSLAPPLADYDAQFKPWLEALQVGDVRDKALVVIAASRLRPFDRPPSVDRAIAAQRPGLVSALPARIAAASEAGRHATAVLLAKALSVLEAPGAPEVGPLADALYRSAALPLRDAKRQLVAGVGDLLRGPGLRELGVARSLAHIQRLVGERPGITVIMGPPSFELKPVVKQERRKRRMKDKRVRNKLGAYDRAELARSKAAYADTLAKAQQPVRTTSTCDPCWDRTTARYKRQLVTERGRSTYEWRLTKETTRRRVHIKSVGDAGEKSAAQGRLARDRARYERAQRVAANTGTTQLYKTVSYSARSKAWVGKASQTLSFQRGKQLFKVESEVAGEFAKGWRWDAQPKKGLEKPHNSWKDVKAARKHARNELEKAARKRFAEGYGELIRRDLRWRVGQFQERWGADAAAFEGAALEALLADGVAGLLPALAPLAGSEG